MINGLADGTYLLFARYGGDIYVPAGTSNIVTVIVGTPKLTSNPLPTQNPGVVALIGAQTQAVRQFASSHLNNFNQRMESLHGNGWASSPFGMGVTSAALSGTDAAWSNQGDTVNYADSELARLRQNMRPTGFTLAQASQPANDGAGLPELQASSGPLRQELAWWIGGALDLGQQKGSSGGKLTTGGVSFGGDYRINPVLTLGAGAGYSRSNFQSDAWGAKSTGQSVVGVLYAGIRPSDQAYVDIVAGFGQLHFDLSRYVSADAANAVGARGGYQTFGSLTAGYEWRGDRWLLSPYGRVDIARARLDSYTESGSTAALTYFKQTVRSDTASLGLRSEWRYRLANSTLVPQARVAYQHSLQGAGQASMQYANANLSGTVYTLGDIASQSSQWLFSLGSKLLLDSETMLSLVYSYGASNDQYSSHSLQFSVSGKF